MSPSLTSNSSNKRIRLKKPMFSLMSIPNKYCTGQWLSLITKTSLILTHNSFQSITISNMSCQSLVSSLSLPLIICSSRIVAKHPNWLVPPQTNEFFCTRTLQVKQNYGKGGGLRPKGWLDLGWREVTVGQFVYVLFCIERPGLWYENVDWTVLIQTYVKATLNTHTRQCKTCQPRRGFPFLSD